MVFIHRSIKTRIETETMAYMLDCSEDVFIHRSIKTRIETFLQWTVSLTNSGFYT